MCAPFEGGTQRAAGGTSVQLAGTFNLIKDLAQDQLRGNGSQELLSDQAAETRPQMLQTGFLQWVQNGLGANLNQFASVFKTCFKTLAPAAPLLHPSAHR